MPLSFDDMHLIEGNVESITFRAMEDDESESFTDTSITTAYGVAATRGESSGVATGDKVWHIRASLLSSAPKEHDRVVDSASRVWIVDQIQVMDHGTRYRLTCTLGRKEDGTMG